MTLLNLVTLWMMILVRFAKNAHWCFENPSRLARLDRFFRHLLSRRICCGPILPHTHRLATRQRLAPVKPPFVLPLFVRRLFPPYIPLAFLAHLIVEHLNPYDRKYR